MGKEVGGSLMIHVDIKRIVDVNYSMLNSTRSPKLAYTMVFKPLKVNGPLYAQPPY